MAAPTMHMLLFLEYRKSGRENNTLQSEILAPRSSRRLRIWRRRWLVGGVVGGGAAAVQAVGGMHKGVLL